MGLNGVAEAFSGEVDAGSPKKMRPRIES